MEIIVPLKEIEVTEGEKVTLTCEVNRPDVKAKWFKDNVEIKSTEARVLTVDGCLHTLTLPSAELDDEAEYTIKLEDKSSKALVLVNGMMSLFSITQSSYMN